MIGAAQRSAALVAAWLTGGCVLPAFACSDDGDCAGGGAMGRCEASGYCSFVDDHCASGRRYGGRAGEGLAGSCVPAMAHPGAPDDLVPVATSGDGSGSDDDGDANSSDAGSSDIRSSDASSGDGGTGESSSSGDPIDLDAGLVLHLTFSSDAAVTGTSLDDSGLGHHATCPVDACPSAVAGVLGDAAHFDGIDDRLAVTTDASLEPTDALTIAAWVRLDVLPATNATVIARAWGATAANSFELYYDHERGRLRWNLDAAGAVAVPLGTPVAGTWVHVAGTWDGELARGFTDGVAVGETAATASLAYDDHDILLGADVDAGALDNWLPGSIDEVRIYDRVLTDAEIANLADP